VAEGARQPRNDDEENHYRGVHAEEHDVEVLRHLLSPALREPAPDVRDGAGRPAELHAHAQRQNPADEQEDDAGDQELNPNDLVIFGEDVLAQEPQLGVGVRGRGMTDTHERTSQALSAVRCPSSVVIATDDGQQTTDNDQRYFDSTFVGFTLVAFWAAWVAV